MPDDGVDNLLRHVAADPQSAAARLFAQYADRLVGYARRRVSSRLQSKFDPEDIVQSALKSFFRGQHATMAERLLEPNSSGNSPEVDPDQPDELWGLLVVITLRKCQKYIKLYHRDIRDVNREVSGVTDESDREYLQLIDRQPTPAEDAVLNDTIEKLSEHLTEPEREMLHLRLEGATVDEIAEQCHCPKRTVERLLARLRDNLRDENDRGIS